MPDSPNRSGTKMMILFLLVLAAGCTTDDTPPPLDTANMDLSVRPGDDFYRYANGAWIDTTELPDDRSSYDAFDIVRLKRDEDVRNLIREVAKDKSAAPGSTTQKIRDFYRTAMDLRAVNSAGIEPLRDEFTRIDAIASPADLADALAYLHARGLDACFGGGVEQDLLNTKIFKFYLMQAGIGLPDVDYYTNPDERSQEIRSNYEAYVAEMFGLLGEDAAAATAHAGTVLALELRMAAASKTRLELRDLAGWYNLMTMSELAQHAPRFDWQRYFAGLSEIDFGDVVVVSPRFIAEIGDMMSTVAIDDWKTYLRWNLINNLAPYLSDDFVMARYRFYSEFLSGSEQIRPRWERVVGEISGSLGQPLGQLYVAKHFTPESKVRMVDLCANLKAALRVRLETVSWMGDETRARALAKLEKMRLKVGYPDKWDDYSGMDIRDDSYVQNVLRANFFNYHKELKRFVDPPDPDHWSMDPQTVNAGYHPLRNDITFPAGILQPPFFHPDADDAVNYGAIGVAIGHEMTHGFDDQGRLFDSEGNMSGWWTDVDSEEFERRTQPLIAQYDRFIAVDDVHCDGRLTLGENLADFGGLTVALAAYELSRVGRDPAPDIDGFTDRQRFFLSYAQLWRGKIRDKALIRQCKEDVHPWGEFRANGAPFNVPGFYDAFAIVPNDALYIAPAERPVIW